MADLELCPILRQNNLIQESRNLDGDLFGFGLHKLYKTDTDMSNKPTLYVTKTYLMTNIGNGGHGGVSPSLFLVE